MDRTDFKNELYELLYGYFKSQRCSTIQELECEVFEVTDTLKEAVEDYCHHYGLPMLRLPL